MATLNQYIQSHPVASLLIGAVNIAAAELLPLTNIHVPPLVMELFQLGAWSVAMIVGVVTIYGKLKKR